MPFVGHTRQTMGRLHGVRGEPLRRLQRALESEGAEGSEAAMMMPRGALAAALYMFPLVAAAPPVALSAQPLSGSACVVDGDTLVLGSTPLNGQCSPGVTVRLFAIDAPERNQTCDDKSGREYPCGEIASDALRELVAGKRVTCERRGKPERYQPEFAVCSVRGGPTLNDAMVRRGWALAYRRYSGDFIAAEEEAQRARRGMWAGTFKSPAEWRRSHVR